MFLFLTTTHEIHFISLLIYLFHSIYFAYYLIASQESLGNHSFN